MGFCSLFLLIRFDYFSPVLLNNEDFMGGVGGGDFMGGVYASVCMYVCFVSSVCLCCYVYPCGGWLCSASSPVSGLPVASRIGGISS